MGIQPSKRDKLTPPVGFSSLDASRASALSGGVQGQTICSWRFRSAKEHG